MKRDLDLIESEERLRNILEHMPASVYMKGIDGKYQYMNREAAKTLGVSAADVVGKSDFDLLPESIARAWRESDAAVLTQKASIHRESIFQSNRDFVTVKFPVYKGGRIDSICGISTEVTELRSLEREKLKLAAVLEQSLDFIATSTMEGHLTYINSAGRKIIGLDRTFDVAQLTIADIVCEKDHAKLRDGMERLLRVGYAQDEACFANRITGQAIPMWWSSLVVKDTKTGKPIALATISRDLSSVKETEKKLEQRTEELERSNRDLEQFAYIASHDLKEPLRTMANYVYLIEQRISHMLDPATREYLTFVERGSKRMSSLIDSLLRYARVGGHTLALSRIDSKKILLAVIQSLELLLKESLASIEVVSELPEIWADRDLVEELFTNLISNAVKFRRPTIRPEVKVGATKKGNEWVFSVSDNGIGMTSEQVEKAFDLFRRFHGRGEYPGEGIGLATVKRIIERHRGKIWVDSTPRVGSTFFFSIPTEKKMSGDPREKFNPTRFEEEG